MKEPEPAGWRRAASRSLILGVMFILAGCSAEFTSSVPSGGGPPAELPPSASIVFCENPDPGCTPAASYSIKKLRNLVVSVRWIDVPQGNHLQTVRIVLPDGNLYQSFERSFEIAADPGGFLQLAETLPISGSHISRRALTGDWTVEALLDGRNMASQTVRLDP